MVAKASSSKAAAVIITVKATAAAVLLVAGAGQNNLSIVTLNQACADFACAVMCGDGFADGVPKVVGDCGC